MFAAQRRDLDIARKGNERLPRAFRPERGRAAFVFVSISLIPALSPHSRISNQEKVTLRKKYSIDQNTFHSQRSQSKGESLDHSTNCTDPDTSQILTGPSIRLCF